MKKGMMAFEKIIAVLIVVIVIIALILVIQKIDVLKEAFLKLFK